MSYPHTLRSRVEASIKDVRQGTACMLQVTAADKAEALRMIGQEPVICGTRDELLDFLREYAPNLFDHRRR